MTGTLYFAYGSNLNYDDRNRWCEEQGFSPETLNFKFCSIGYLPDRDICFSYRSRRRGGGVLDIKPRTGQIVPGVIFEVQGEGWKQLDRKEGAKDAGKGCYQKISAVALDARGQEGAVATYQVNPGFRERFVPPTQEYVDLVREGLEAFGLPTKALDAASRNETTPLLSALRQNLWVAFGLVSGAIIAFSEEWPGK